MHASDHSSTIQLLVEETGNRTAVRELLEDRYAVDTQQTVRDADLYLVDDHAFPAHHAALRERVEAGDPVFCPVVLVRRSEGGRRVSLPDPDEREPPLLVDDVVTAPLNRTLLCRRLDTLLVRRRQSKELRHSLSKLEKSNRSLEQFASAVSHDLQEPLRMVSSYLGLIDERYGEELDADGEEFIDYAVDGADRMRDMIQGLLDYSRVDTRGNPLEPTDLGAVLDDVRTDLRLLIEDSDARISVGDLPRVEGDADQLRQLFQNLLSNAIKYSGDGPPRIRVSAERAETKWAVSVADDGVGIDPDDRQRIFDVFQRLHSREECSGTGIGLSLCQRIVERHGGEITVDSEPGDGSTFTVTLPAVDSGDTIVSEPPIRPPIDGG